MTHKTKINEATSFIL